MAQQSGTNGDTPVLDLLARMTADSLQVSKLVDRTLVLVRVAALVAMDAAPASYLMNLGAASDMGVTPEEITDTLAAIAPIVGAARTVSALGKIMRALGFALEVAEEYAAVEGE